MIRREPFTVLLVATLFLLSLACAGLAFNYVQGTRKQIRLQHQVAAVNRNRALAQSLAGEAAEYSKRNPAIDPILQSIGMKKQPVGAR